MSATEVRELSVVLGASSWPELGAETFSSPGFAAVARRWRTFVGGRSRVEPNDELWLFDDEGDGAKQLRVVRDFLVDRASSGRPPDLLWVYYAGHGAFLGPDERYSLLVKGTEEDLAGSTSIPFADLGTLLKRHAARTDVIVVLDCCFASSAISHLQADVGDVMTAKAADLVSQGGGIALLCAASSTGAARVLTDDSGTMFSSALLEIIERGRPGAGPMFSLRQLREFTWDRIRTLHGDKAIRPHVHAPNQRRGDLSDRPLVANVAHRSGRAPERRPIDEVVRSELERIADHEQVHLSPSIPTKLLNNARYSHSVPELEQVVGLILLAKSRTAPGRKTLLFTTWGIRYRPSRLDKSVGLSYDELASIPCEYRENKVTREVPTTMMVPKGTPGFPTGGPFNVAPGPPRTETYVSRSVHLGKDHRELTLNLPGVLLEPVAAIINAITAQLIA